MSDFESGDDAGGPPRRVERGFADHDAFEHVDGGTFDSVTTAFDGTVRARETDDGRLQFEVTVRVPLLDQVTEDTVAAVVESGWADTFRRRVVDVGGVTRGDHEFDPEVTRTDEEIAVTFTFSEINERRGVNDANALVNFVEGTYVQGIIPGYEYTDPVSGLLSKARKQGNSDVV